MKSCLPSSSRCHRSPAPRPRHQSLLRRNPAVLLIAVDQFRYDYLTRFRGDFTSGFKRLLTEGAVFTDANLEHYRPSPRSVMDDADGATPSVSGIIGNDWFDRETGTQVQSITDTTVKPIGAPDAATASPRRLLVSTLGDELKLASGAPKGSEAAPRVIGMSLAGSLRGDAGSAAPTPRLARHQVGAFVSSTYYMPDASAWVKAFNDRHLADTHLGRGRRFRRPQCPQATAEGARNAVL